MLERVAPAESGKPAEVRVIGMHLGLVFYRQCSDVRVGHEIRAGAGRVKIPPKVPQVLGVGVDRRHVGVLKPLRHAINGLRGQHGKRQCTGMGHQLHESG